MKINLLLSAITLLGGSLLTANASPKDDVAAAATKLGEKPNYSWKTTVVVPESSRFRPGPTEGKTEKNGFTHLTITTGDNTTQAVLKGDKAAISSPDGGWQSLSELDSAERSGRFRAMAVRNFKAPAAQAAELAAGAKELTNDGESLSGALTEDAVKRLLTFGRRGGGDAPAINGARGLVKFWLKDGLLSKYEVEVSGTLNFTDNQREVSRTMTTEIKDVGATKVDVPEDAKKKL